MVALEKSEYISNFDLHIGMMTLKPHQIAESCWKKVNLKSPNLVQTLKYTGSVEWVPSISMMMMLKNVQSVESSCEKHELQVNSRTKPDYTETRVIRFKIFLSKLINAHRKLIRSNRLCS